MQRTANQKDQKPTWRKITGGSLYLSVGSRGTRVRIKPKEEVQFTKDELKNFVDQFELIHPGSGQYMVDKTSFAGDVEEEEPKKGEIPPPRELEEYNLKHRGAGWWDVFSSSGKKMNENKLSKTDAEKLKEQLEAEASGDE